ncbi:MAG: FHA domain-containing protein [Planctomycetes bacterium]|nr:FHA domain-containing protein [Planctomycetota bacterium]
MKVSLRVTKGHHAGKVVAVNRQRFLIGRNRHSHLQVTSSKVSVHHCAIMTRPGRVWIHDLGSTNGTYVNERKIVDDQDLNHGDQLQIGPLVVEVQIEAVQTEEERSAKSISDSQAAEILLKTSTADKLVGLDDDSEYESTVLNYPMEARKAEKKKKDV